MKILNKRTGETICSDVGLADTFLSRFIGLMMSSSKKNLLLKSEKEGIKESSIHMLFMLYPIDAIWLDSEKKIVDIKKNLKPFSMRIFKPKKPAMYVLEIGKGRLGENTDLREGDLLKF